ncbi:MAG: hypothetical protein EOP10_21420 [Proteobacteria bacterium]|nr:MAG: hypothetical protein EOP10_21420 [Pseudomonadota bacterium]
MLKFSLLIPGVLTLAATAEGAQPSSSNMRYFVQDSTPSAPTTTDAGTGVIGEVEQPTVNPENAREAEGDEEDDPSSSDAIRSRRAQSVEVFVDYSTFVTDQEDFSPIAYGLKYSRFVDRDLKYGASIGVENFQLNDDESDVFVEAPVGQQVIERNIDIEGSAVRLGVHGQYFVENSLNAQLSLFGSVGRTEKEGTVDSQYYGRTAISISLGNQWSWEDFTLSWNWLSLTYNLNAKIGSTNLLTEYPSNRSGGMVLLAGLSFGAEF